MSISAGLKVTVADSPIPEEIKTNLQAPLKPTVRTIFPPLTPAMFPRDYNPDLVFDLRVMLEKSGSDNLNMSNDAPPSFKELEKEFALKVDSAPRITSTTVVNLSRYELTEAEYKLLGLGKKFVTSPGEPDLGEIRSDEDTFHQSCRRIHFLNKMMSSPSTNDMGTFKNALYLGLLLNGNLHRVQYR